MKTLFVAILIIITYSIGIAQSTASITYLDSLKHQLSICKEDTSRILIMAELCNIYRSSKPDTALFYGEKAINMAQSLNFSKGLVRAIAQVGNVYTNIGNLPKALKMQYSAIQIAEENKLLYEEASLFGSVASIYAVLKNYPKTLNYFRKSKQIYELYQDKRNIAFMDMNLGSAFDNLNQLDSSMYYLQKAYKEMNETKGGIYPYWYRGMGRLQHKLGNDNLALQYLHQGIQVARENNNHRILAFELNDISSIYKKQNLIDSSIFYAKLALKEAEQISFKQHILIASSQLAELYEPIDSKQAVAYYKIAAATRESLFDLGNMHMITQEEENQKEIANQKEIYQNKLKQYALIGGLGMLLLIALFLYRNSQKQKKAKNLLQEQKDKVDKTLSQLKATQAQLIQSEKLASLGELTAGIAHEIQNPLNFVNNFSELSVDLVKDLKDELKKPEKDEVYIDELFDDLSQNQEKINHHGKRASSIVKGMLEHSRASTGVKELTDINKLADEYLRLAYHGLRAKDKDFNAEYELIIDENLPKIEVIPQDIGRVLLNLINNAFYAIHQRNVETLHATSLPKYQPIVTVSTEKIDNQIIIKVKDNGIGMPESVKVKVFQPFFTTKPTGQGTGLGLSLAYDIVTKGHGGALEVISTEGVGSEFIISLPLKTNG
jgi:two-component system, NtrC family, sensor kinase